MRTSKWGIEIRDSYICGDQTITRTHGVIIPPTTGDRTDIIGESGKYYYGMSKKEFNMPMTKEEYLELTLPGLDDKEKKTALKNIQETPRKIKDTIAIVIEIKQGKITLTK